MRVLLLTYYFPPDLGAGAFRSAALVAPLLESLPADCELDIIASYPNRYKSFTKATDEEVVAERLSIFRVRVPQHRSDIVGQSLAFVRFSLGVRKIVSERKYDLVIATSSRLMTAALGASIARKQGCKLILDIRDLFVDMLDDLLGGWCAILAKRIFRRVERWTFSKVELINVVSPGFLGYIRAGYPEKEITVFPNGIDDEFMHIDPMSFQSAKNGVPEILYAGNVGAGQNLHLVIPKLASRLRGKARFSIIGDGGRIKELKAVIAQGQLEGVVSICAPIERDRLIERYRDADIVFLHLNAHEAFQKVLPSKIFEYASLGKPIFAGVSGFAATFLENEVDNAAVFPPLDIDAAVEVFEKLTLGNIPRKSFRQKYARRKISHEFAKRISERLVSSSVVAGD